jgi:hypothetical protein
MVKRTSARKASSTRALSAPLFLSLDFLYVPTRDPERDLDYYTRVLGGTAVFRVKAMDTEVAGVRLSQDGPLVLLAEHLEGELPVLVYRVANLKKTRLQLKRRGWTPRDEFEIPRGPCAIFEAGGGQHMAIYELTRPGANDHFLGRFDE